MLLINEMNWMASSKTDKNKIQALALCKSEQPKWLLSGSFWELGKLSFLRQAITEIWRKKYQS